MASDRLTDEEWAEEVASAQAAGFAHGEGAASWLLDGNSTDENATRIMRGIRDGDPEVLDALPTFSFGEWAGEAEDDILPDVLLLADWDSLDSEERGELADAYLEGFSDGVVAGAEVEAQAFLTGRRAAKRRGKRRR